MGQVYVKDTMLFSDAFKDAKAGDKHGRLEKTDFNYTCLICLKVVTGWRDCKDVDIPLPVCSDECLDARDSSRSPT